MMENFQKFLLQYPTKSFQKGEIILHQGDRPQYAYVIKEGYIKNYDITHRGEEKELMFDCPYEVFPIGWVFSRIKRTQYYYEAFTDAIVYLVPKEDYAAFLKKDTQQLFEIFQASTIRLLHMQQRILGLEQLKAGDKVLYTLNFLCSRFGSDAANTRVRLLIPLTQQDFANFVGLTRETTAIELKKLERQGVISYNHQRYTIYPKKLAQFLEER